MWVNEALFVTVRTELRPMTYGIASLLSPRVPGWIIMAQAPR